MRPRLRIRLRLLRRTTMRLHLQRTTMHRRPIAPPSSSPCRDRHNSRGREDPAVQGTDRDSAPEVRVDRAVVPEEARVLAPP